MNLVTLSEQLKDVPDNFLVEEVQEPTGAYPAYLVVSELSRRKRMREAVQKEKPTTTVVEDLAGLNALPQAAQSLSARDVAGMGAPKQPMPQMPQQPMPQQQPAMMAEGGLVAFQQGGDIYDMMNMTSGAVYGKPVGQPEIFYEGDRPYTIVDGQKIYGPVDQRKKFVGPQSQFDKDIEDTVIPEAIDTAKKIGRGIVNIPMVIKEGVESYFSSDPDAQKNFDKQRTERLKTIRGDNEGIYQVTPSARDPRRSSPEAVARAKENVLKDPENQKKIADAIRKQDPKIGDKFLSERSIIDQTEQSVEKDKKDLASIESEIQEIGKPSGNDSSSSIKGKFASQFKAIDALDQKISDAYSGAESFDDLKAKGEEEYQKKYDNPLRFLEDEIKKDEASIKQRKFDNINDALIKAGAKILQAKGGRNLKWLGEGLEGFQDAYTEGRKEILEAKKDVLKSKIAFAESENLFQQNKEKAGLAKFDRAQKNLEIGINRLKDKKASFVSDVNMQLQISQVEAGITKDLAQADYYSTAGYPKPKRLSFSDIEKIESTANINVAQRLKDFDKSSPVYKRELEAEINRLSQIKLARMNNVGLPPLASQQMPFSSLGILSPEDQALMSSS